jgi:hypothetical protein
MKCLRQVIFITLKMICLGLKTTKYYSQPDNYSQVFIAITKALINMKNHSDLYTYDLLIE